MSAENRLHFFRMCAWGMFDPDQLEARERKIRLKQIRHVIEDLGWDLHVGVWGSTGKERYPYYSLSKYNPRRKVREQHSSFRSLEPICASLLPLVDKKFPPKE